MKRRKPTTLPLGVISESTLRPEDLIPAYLDALNGLRLSKAERATVRQCQRDWQNAECNQDGAGTFADDDLGDVLDDLINVIDAHCPDYSYFGSLEGDGACFGVWPSIESLEEDAQNGDIVKVSDMGDLAQDEQRLAMLVNDHGNVTLYRRASRRAWNWREVWSVV